MGEEKQEEKKMEEKTELEKLEAQIEKPKEGKSALEKMEEKMKIEREEAAEEKPEEEKKPEPKEEEKPEEAATQIFALRTTANREDQVMDFMTSNVTKKGLNVFSIIRPHGMRGYIFVEAASRLEAEQAAHGIPYARGILPKEIAYSEMEHMIEPMKRERTFQA
jgi:hypothetical protein